MVTLIVPNINSFLPSSTFPTTKGVRFFNRIELLAIPQVPLWSFSGGRRSRSFRDGHHSLQIWILLSISGGRMKEEAWRTKPKNLEEQGGLPCHPRQLHQQALRLSAKPDGNCSAGQRNAIQDINYFNFSPWWNTRLIFHLLFYLLFEKDKMYWLSFDSLSFDWLLFATRLLSR